MDGVRSNGFKLFFSISIGLILGMIIGAASLNTLISYRIDEYLAKIATLEGIIEEKDIKLKKLEESINQKKYILKSIEIVLLYEGDEINSLTLQKHIKEKYIDLVGKDIMEIDIELIAQIIDKRLMKLDKNIYQLYVEKIFLKDVLKIWVRAEEVS